MTMVWLIFLCIFISRRISKSFFYSFLSPKNYDDGGYSEWTTYSGCSAVCEGESGIRVRRRFCNNPLPSRNGKTCFEQGLGNHREEEICIGKKPYQSDNRKEDCYIDQEGSGVSRIEV